MCFEKKGCFLISWAVGEVAIDWVIELVRTGESRAGDGKGRLTAVNS